MTSSFSPSKSGFLKIVKTCRLARSEGLDYAWIDTCCIDKTSSAELTETINSMFRWYQKARVCYAYLSDLHTTFGKPVLTRCAWFTPGWTLQELLASSNIQFYNSSWTLIGTKTQLERDLSKITGIPLEAINGTRPLKDFSAAQRMSWASRRVTTRTEHMAYCLLGLFDVHMPLVYGEGTKAFYRLQEKIIKRSVDPSLFAWKPSKYARGCCSVLAAAPADFEGCGSIEPFSMAISEYSLTNRGLKLTAALMPYEASPRDGLDQYRGSTFILPLAKGPFAEYEGDTDMPGYTLGIVLVKAAPFKFIRLASPGHVRLGNYEDWQRESTAELMYWEYLRLGATVTHAFHMLTEVEGVLEERDLSWPHGIYFPVVPGIEMTGDCSLSYWDSFTRIHSFLPVPYHITAFTFVARLDGYTLEFGLLLDCRHQRLYPRCVLIDTSTSYSRLFFLLVMRDQSTPMSWNISEKQMPEITRLSNLLRIASGVITFNITASVIHRQASPMGYASELSLSVSPLETSSTTPIPRIKVSCDVEEAQTRPIQPLQMSKPPSAYMRRRAPVTAG